MQRLSNPWIAVLGNTLLRTYDIAGATWAWRVTRLVHALPYLALAWGFGWVSGWFWALPEISPVISAWLCSGAVAALMGWSWFKEWRRAY
jgi:hypothetical protein